MVDSNLRPLILRAHFGGVNGIVQVELLEQTALAPSGTALVLVGSDDVHLDFG